MRLQRGEKLPMSKAMFRLLSNCKSDYFEVHWERIMTRQVSFKEVLENSSTVSKYLATKLNIAKEANIVSFEALKLKYPEKINDNIAKTFAGAVTMGKKRNLAGVLLSRFVKELDNDKFDEYVKTEELTSITDFGLDMMEEFDVIVYDISDDKPDYVDDLIVAVGLQRKEYKAVLLVLHSDKELRRVISKLDYWNADTAGQSGQKKSSMEIVQILFEKKTEGRGDKQLIEENIQYAILFGKFHVFHPPLCVLNNEMKSSLKSVISKISPPLSKIALVQTGNQEVVTIHDERDRTGCAFTYFASKLSLEKFMLNQRSSVKDEDKPSVNMDDTEVVNDMNLEGEEDMMGMEDQGDEKRLERNGSTSRF